MKKSLILSTLAVGLAASTLAFAADPCLSIAGSWSGTLDTPAFNTSGQYLGQCTSNLTSTIDSYQNVISLQGNTNGGGCTFPARLDPGKISMSGTCSNAQISLNSGTWTGVVINNKINLQESYQGHGGAMNLSKTSTSTTSRRVISEQEAKRDHRAYLVCAKGALSGHYGCTMKK